MYVLINNKTELFTYEKLRKTSRKTKIDVYEQGIS